MQKLRTDNFNIKLYFIDRLVRLYIVLIPALILSGALALILQRYFNVEFSNLNINDFIGSLFFVQTIYTDHFAQNEPLWSLANEFWYYTTFPLMIFIYINKYKYLSVGLFIIIMSQLPVSIILYFLVWLLGVGLFCIKKRFLPLWLSVIVLVIILIVSRLGIISNIFIIDGLVAISTFLLINSYIYSDEKKIFTKTFNFNEKMADYSYTIYLVHFSMVLLFTNILIKLNIQFLELGVKNFIIFIICLMVVYIYGYLVYLISEKHTYTIKKYIKKRYSAK